MVSILSLILSLYSSKKNTEFVEIAITTYYIDIYECKYIVFFKNTDFKQPTKQKIKTFFLYIKNTISSITYHRHQANRLFIVLSDGDRLFPNLSPNLSPITNHFQTNQYIKPAGIHLLKNISLRQGQQIIPWQQVFHAEKQIVSSNGNQSFKAQKLQFRTVGTKVSSRRNYCFPCRNLNAPIGTTPCLQHTAIQGYKKRANYSAPPLKNPHKWDSSFSSFIYSFPENYFLLIPSQNNLFPKN